MTRVVHTFPNGYSGSVIDTGYGHTRGLFEVAVLAADGRITYDTPITDNVIGWLSEDEVADVLEKIKALPRVSVEALQRDRKEHANRFMEQSRSAMRLEREART